MSWFNRTKAKGAVIVKVAVYDVRRDGGGGRRLGREYKRSRSPSRFSASSASPPSAPKFLLVLGVVADVVDVVENVHFLRDGLIQQRTRAKGQRQSSGRCEPNIGCQNLWSRTHRGSLAYNSKINYFAKKRNFGIDRSQKLGVEI